MSGRRMSGRRKQIISHGHSSGSNIENPPGKRAYHDACRFAAAPTIPALAYALKKSARRAFLQRGPGLTSALVPGRSKLPARSKIDRLRTQFREDAKTRSAPRRAVSPPSCLLMAHSGRVACQEGSPLAAPKRAGFRSDLEILPQVLPNAARRSVGEGRGN
jgi:hypothetical protein